MKVTVLIRPKAGILDPQGEAVRESLRKLGFAVDRARVGRLVDVELETDDPEEARAQAERMSSELLANPLIESFEIVERRSVSRIAVVTFPGSNDDGDAALALELLGTDVARVWHADDGAARRRRWRAAARGLLLRRLPALRRDRPLRTRDGRRRRVRGRRRAGARHLQRVPDPLRGGSAPWRAPPEPAAAVHLRRRRRSTVETTRTPFTQGCDVGARLVIPVKHGEGSWYADDALFAELEARDQIVFRYDGDVNGARARVAGVTNEAGNVLGLMPHPEHAVDPLLGPTGGRPILEGLIAAARAQLPLVG